MKKNKIKSLLILLLFAFSILSMINLFSQKTENSSNVQSCLADGCHKDLMGQKTKHNPAVDDCSGCHNQTGENHPKNVGKEFTTTDSVPALCKNCHETDAAGINSEHQPFKEGVCTSCHNPHSSKNKFLLKDINKKPLCLSCHDFPEKSNSSHSFVKSGKCSECHSGHSSKFRTLLKSDDNKICLNCHNREIKSQKRLLESISGKLNSKFAHPAVTEEKCTSCHLPHNSMNTNLLKSNFSNKFYSDNPKESFSMCFDCHDKSIIENSISENTQFRNGTKNLHFTHVNGSKSRNCLVCHDIHGSDQKGMIRKSVKFGTWVFDLNYVKDENSSSCQPGCHKKFEYSPIEKKNIVLSTPKSEVIENTAIAGKLILPENFDVSSLDEYLIKVKNIDLKIDTIIKTDQTLQFSLSNLPDGTYKISLDSNTAEELSIKNNIPEINIEISNSGVISNHPKQTNLIIKNIKPKIKIVPNIPKTFNLNSSDPKSAIRRNDLAYLKSVCRYLKKHPKYKVVVTAHTDNAGTYEELQKKSQLVAESVANKIKECVIDKSRVQPFGKGSLQPIADNKTAIGRAKNNRVEITVIK